jgi:hypothetical protein
MLTFICVGPLIQMILQAMLTVCYLAYTGIGNGTYWTTGIAPQFTGQVLTVAMVMSFLTGLIAGIWERLFGRIRARAMFVISLVHPYSLWLALAWFMPSLWSGIRSGNMQVYSLFFAPAAIAFLSFVASMMACWKLIDIVRGKSPARDKTPAVDVVQLFD